MSPAHSRQSSFGQTRTTAEENDKNIINASYHGPSSNGTLPHYQLKLNEQIKEHYNQKHRMPAIAISNGNGAMQNIGTVDYTTNTGGDVRHTNNNHHARNDFYHVQKESKATDSNCHGMNGDGGGVAHQSDERDSTLASESNYGSMQQPQCNGNKDAFSYKTLSGGFVRSVHPPGKGSVVNYKVDIISYIYILFEYVCQVVCLRVPILWFCL